MQLISNITGQNAQGLIVFVTSELYIHKYIYACWLLRVCRISHLFAREPSGSLYPSALILNLALKLGSKTLGQ